MNFSFLDIDFYVFTSSDRSEDYRFYHRRSGTQRVLKSLLATMWENSGESDVSNMEA